MPLYEAARIPLPNERVLIIPTGTEGSWLGYVQGYMPNGDVRVCTGTGGPLQDVKPETVNVIMASR